MSKKLKPRDKITQKMSRDGLIEVNETAGPAELVSGREQDADFSKQPEQAAQAAAQQAVKLGYKAVGRVRAGENGTGVGEARRFFHHGKSVPFRIDPMRGEIIANAIDKTQK